MVPGYLERWVSRFEKNEKEDIMNIKERLAFKKKLIRTALGEEKSDLVLNNCCLVNLYTNQVERANIGVIGGYIATVTPEPIEGYNELDCSGYYVLPGFIDGHMHIESTLVTLNRLAEIVLPCGTTTLLVDPHEIGNVCGVRGIKALLTAAEDLPLNIFVQIPSRVPSAPGLETSGAVIGAEEVREMLELTNANSLGELDPSKIIPPRDEYLLKILYAENKNKIRVGHAAGLSGTRLRAYLAAGINDDHECITKEEALERISLGMEILIREGSSERNLKELIKVVTEDGVDSRFLSFCTDDKHANDIRREGHIDYNVRQAIELGVDPFDAIRMASLNSARHFRIDDQVGSLAPSRRADMILVKSLEKPIPSIVIAQGRIVARDGRMVVAVPEFSWPEWALKTINIGGVMTADRFRLEVSGRQARVRGIEIIKGQIVNRAIEAELPIVDGEVASDISQDILKLVCVERHVGTGEIGIGFVRGIGLKSGAFACSVAHDHHNIMAVATNNQDLAVAVNAIQEMQGGLVVVDHGSVLGSLSLPVAGLMTNLPVSLVEEKIEELNLLVAQLGCSVPAPYMLLSFISLPTVPDFGLSNKGLIDVRNHTLISTLL